jgi:tRNA(adenine34) deaminase
MYDEKYMRLAIKEAKKGAKKMEIPVGAVIVRGGEVVAKKHNLKEKKGNAICHAEIEAISAAVKKIGDWRLTDCDMYVTLEPCPMCMGAIVNTRVKNLYFGAYDPDKQGNFQVNVEGGYMGY